MFCIKKGQVGGHVRMNMASIVVPLFAPSRKMNGGLLESEIIYRIQCERNSYRSKLTLCSFSIEIQSKAQNMCDKFAVHFDRPMPIKMVLASITTFLLTNFRVFNAW